MAAIEGHGAVLHGALSLTQPGRWSNGVFAARPPPLPRFMNF